jgi:hypothetical protein
MITFLLAWAAVGSFIHSLVMFRNGEMVGGYANTVYTVLYAAAALGVFG